MGETSFVETEALLACLGDELDEADRMVKDMLPSERRALAKAANQLSDLCSSRCAVCDERMWHGDPRGFVHTGPFRLDGGVYHHATCPLPEEQDR